MGRQHHYDEVVMDTTVDTTKTSASQVPQWARYASVYIPAITNAAVTMEILENDRVEDGDTANILLASTDTSWAAYADEAESSQIAASGVEATWIDISHMIRAMPPNCWIRFVQGAAETGGSALTYKIHYRGA
jgi:hypothetical protein